MDREQMSNEENYHFDVTGFLHVPGVLNSGEVARLNAVLDESGASDGFLSLPEGQRDPFRDLLVHPHLVWYLNQIHRPGLQSSKDYPSCSVPIRRRSVSPSRAAANLAIPARLTSSRMDADIVRASTLSGHSRTSCRWWRLRPRPVHAQGKCRGPRTRADWLDDIGLTQQPAMKAGDLLIVGLSTTQGIRPWATDPVPRLLSFEYTGRGIIRSAGTGPFTETAPRPDWHAELTDEQRSTLHTPGYQDTTPPPTTVTDGQIVRVDATRHKFHPSIYSKSPDSHIDEKEFFFWDLCGYLVLRNVMGRGLA